MSCSIQLFLSVAKNDANHQMLFSTVHIPVRLHQKKAKKTPVLKVVQIMAHVWDGAGYGKARGFGKLNKQDLAKHGTDE